AGEAPGYLIARGYVHLAVDVRGQGSSGGTWCNRCEIEQMDGYEVVQWAAAQAWSDGNVGMYGSSYRAINQMLTAALQPPALKAPVKLLMVDGNHTETSGGSLLPDGDVPGLQQIALRWFDYYLKGLNSRPDLIPPVTVKLKGDGQMETMSAWPRPDIRPRRLYLRGGHRLSTVAPNTLETEEQSAQIYLFGYC